MDLIWRNISTKLSFLSFLDNETTWIDEILPRERQNVIYPTGKTKTLATILRPSSLEIFSRNVAAFTPDELDKRRNRDVSQFVLLWNKRYGTDEVV